MNNKIKFFIFLSLLFLSFFSVFSNGKQEKGFEEIDLNIKNKEYNNALLLLNQYIKENPENFDNAQKRISKIMDVRSEYAELAEEIIYVIINEPTNDEKKLQMIAELESIEENPSEATKEFIEQTKAAAEFTLFKAQFDNLMAQGASFTDEKKYLESLKTNFQGFDLYRTHFHNSGYNAEFVQSVEDRITLIHENINTYEALVSRLDIAHKNLLTAFDRGNSTQSKELFKNYEEIMIEYAELRNSIVEAGWYFRDSFENMQRENPELTEASFLAFAYRFDLGKNGLENSGMLKALDNHWNYYVESLKPNVSNQITYFFQQLYKEIETGDFQFVEKKNLLCKNYLDSVSSFIDIGLGIDNLNIYKKENPDNYSTIKNNPFNEAYSKAKNIVRGFNLLFEDIINFNNYSEEIVNFSLNQDSIALISQKDFSYKDFILKVNNELSTGLHNATNILESLSQIDISFQWRFIALFLENLAEKSKDEHSKLIAKNTSDISNWFVDASNKIATNYANLYVQCYEMLNEDLSPDVLSYPKELQPILNEGITKLTNDIGSLEEVEKFYEVDFSSKQNDKEIISNNIKDLYLLLENSIMLISKAKERVQLAEIAKNEADYRYTQAEKALNSGDYVTCRDFIEKARAKYNESLLYQESEELRLSSDEMLLSLGERIIRAENEIVVKEVRELKTRAKNAYYAGNFEIAESLLSQAKIRWSTTNAESDQEIESLLSLVGNALSMKTGRVIAPTAPLYPEMSQLLNIANQYYNEGKTILANGEKAQAEIYLEEAKKKLREVQTVYPLNQEASLLTLKIDQLIDSKAFNEYFARKVETAKAEYLDKSKQQTVYTELLDLYEINPSYPGLKDFIYNVEIALGIRVKPPDTTALRKSKELTAQAQKIYDGDSRNEISLNSALQVINQALEANPDNTEAQILKDRISTSLGGTGTAVLPASAEKLYQQAVQELQKGNTLQAYAIVSQLMENSTYKKSSKIIDLMKKVESLL